MSLSTGCLVDDPPAYVAPKQTPPRLDNRRALPPLSQVLVVSGTDKIPFSIPVSSEDAGVDLFAVLLIDYQGGGAFGPGITLPASTLDDASRVFQLDWTNPIAPGCHRFTLRATHDGNVDQRVFPELTNKADSDEAYWTVIATGESTNVDPKVLLNCPAGAGSTP